MSKPSGLSLAIVAAGAVASVPAAAAPVTITHSVTLNTLMQGSGTNTLQFDLNDFLSTEGYSPSEVIGGSVSVFGFSDANYGGPVYGNNYNTTTTVAGSHLTYYTYYVGYSYSYRCGFAGWSTCYGYSSYPVTQSYYVTDYNQYSDRDITRTDAVADQMRVTTGGTVSTATASTTSSSTGSFGSYIYDGNNGIYCTNGSPYGCTTYYHRERNVYSALFGSLQVNQALDASALIDLNNDGQLGIGFASPVGQYRLNSVSFDLMVQHSLLSTAASLDSTDVPEPGNLPLTALALAAALMAGHLVRRRRPQP